MPIPATPPDPQAALQALLEQGSEGLKRLLTHGLMPEVRDEYLPWDQLRRRQAPGGMTPEEWWVGISLARGVLKTEVPLIDKTGNRFHFARTDSLLRALDRLERGIGPNPQPPADSQLTSKDIRDSSLIRSLTRSPMEEAITSSQLEGASTTRAVAKDMLIQGRQPRTKDERMIYNNYKAMELIRGRAQEPLSETFLLELHEVLTAGTLEPGEAGRLRRPDELIRGQDIGTGEVFHDPPDARELPSRIEALCAFANASGGHALIHPIVRAIVLHFALAYEHPFVDGNGRTARALFYWSMLRQGYWVAEFLAISRTIQNAPAQYSRAFLYTETDRSDLTYFLVHQLEVIRRAMHDLYAYLERKRNMQQLEVLLQAGTNLNPRQRALLAHALRHPGAQYTIDSHRREHGVVYQTARQDLLDLVEAGYLVKTQVGRAYHFHAVPTLEHLLRQRQPR